MIIKNNKNQTAKEFLIENNFSRKAIRSLKYVIVDGKEVRLWQNLKENDIVDIPLKMEKSDIIPTKGDIHIIYEDNDLLVLNKPHGLSSMPNVGCYTESLCNYVKYYFEENNLNSTVHLVNRLDNDTSGLILIAKSGYVHNLFKKIEIKKKYYAVVEGIIEDDGEVFKPIIKEGNLRVIGGNKMAKTVYHVIRSKTNTLLDIDLLTGRTHQIRVHMKSINHRVINDRLYGDGIDCNLALQSYYLEFIHPINNTLMKFILDLEVGLDERI